MVLVRPRMMIAPWPCEKWNGPPARVMQAARCYVLIQLPRVTAAAAKSPKEGHCPDVSCVAGSSLAEGHYILILGNRPYAGVAPLRSLRAALCAGPSWCHQPICSTVIVLFRAELFGGLKPLLRESLASRQLS
jgi:hypothetical protein